ncbi:MAG: hypothetical protein AMXMBFR7_53190 [Planctomycetota bacterium]
MNTHAKNDFLDVGDDLEITKVAKRESAPGTWVDGTLAGYRFSALVFPEHAEVANYELGTSKISKLWVQRISDKKTVFHWDRGLDLKAADATVTAIVDFLCAGLADYVYAE